MSAAKLLPWALKIRAARNRWQRLPAAERAHLLGYMREEAETFAKTAMFGDDREPMWGRVNLAAVALLVAIAGEPRVPKPKTKRRVRR